jgi:DUF971 family protein
MSCEQAPPNLALPNQVVIHQLSRRLELRWADGSGISLGHARLRSACKCAWCEGHRRRAPNEATTCDPDVQLTTVTPVGDVGLQLHFSDGHDRGIYPWAYLQSLAN